MARRLASSRLLISMTRSWPAAVARPISSRVRSSCCARTGRKRASVRNASQERQAFGCGHWSCSGSPQYPFGSVCFAREMRSLSSTASSGTPVGENGDPFAADVDALLVGVELGAQGRVEQLGVDGGHLGGGVVEVVLDRALRDALVEHLGRERVAQPVGAEAERRAVAGGHAALTRPARQGLADRRRVGGPVAGGGAVAGGEQVGRRVAEAAAHVLLLLAHHRGEVAADRDRRLARDLAATNHLRQLVLCVTRLERWDVEASGNRARPQPRRVH
jgi:hypothetical protein